MEASCLCQHPGDEPEAPCQIIFSLSACAVGFSIPGLKLPLGCCVFILGAINPIKRKACLGKALALLHSGDAADAAAASPPHGTP